MNAVKRNLSRTFLAGLLMLISMSLTAQSQRREISGTVSDENNQGLPGVSVQVKGQEMATSSNAEGKYTLRVPDAGQVVLVFSFVGMESQEVVLGTDDEVNVTLEATALSLDEVVAIGYGTAKKKDLTGAVATLDGEVIAQRNESQLSTALQGLMPGVSATRSSGLPGATADIKVRGITTIGNSDPLVLVDGIPVQSINDINPADVESMSVLKDAASASIYGSRASAGVVLITTKKAKNNEVKLEYNGSYGIVKPTEFPGTVNYKRYMEMINEVAWNDGGNQAGAEYGVYAKDFIDSYAENNRLDPQAYPITDWVDVLVNDQAPTTNHGLALSYGNDVVKSRASVNYEKTDALYNNRSYERITARLNNEVKITDYLSANISGDYRYNITENATNNPLSAAYKYGPLWAPYLSDGRVSEGRNGTNAWARINHGGFDNSWGDEIHGKLGLVFTPIEGLDIRANIAPSVQKTNGKLFIRQVPFYRPEDPTRIAGYINGNLTTSLDEARAEERTMTKQLTANYQKSFAGEHDLSLMVGYEDYYYYFERISAFSDNFLVSDFPYLDRGSLDYMQNTGNAYENAYNSYFGRIMYDYADKYLLQANIRYDGSSRFHKDYRWASFPSVSVGWVPTEENFIKDLDLTALDFFKLRGSWGKLGNERIGNYPYQAIMNFSNALFVEDGKIVSRITAAQQAYNIRDISWETTESWNIGFDARLFNNRLSVTGDYYKKTTRDMLLDLEIPDFMGYGNPSQNAGKMHTRGWEAEVSWNDHIGDFKYAISANISDYKSVMGNLSGIVFDGSQIIREGSEYNEWYGYLSDGLFQSQDDIDNSALLSTVVRPGDVKYRDISGPDGVPDGKISPEYDRTLLGGSLPRYLYGGNISLGYKNFDAFIMFQGIGKQTSRLLVDMVYQTAGWYTFPDFVDGNYYSEYNTVEQNQSARYPRLSQLAYDGNNYEASDYWLFDGSYFRLKNVTLGYTLPSTWLNQAKISNVRVYASVNDLFSADHYPKGWDPESGLTAYIARTWNFGLQIRF